MKKPFLNIDPYSFTTSAFIIGIILTKELSNDEQDSIGNWIQLIGLTMQTYSSQKTTLNSEIIKEETDLETIKKVIKKIEEELEKLSRKKKD